MICFDLEQHQTDALGASTAIPVNIHQKIFLF